MVEKCSPAVFEDRGHTLKVDGPESLAISICDVSYKLINLKIILLLIHCLVDMPTSQEWLSYLAICMHCRRDGVRRQMSYSSRCALEVSNCDCLCTPIGLKGLPVKCLLNIFTTDCQHPYGSCTLLLL